MLINQFAKFLLYKSVLYLFSVIDNLRFNFGGKFKFIGYLRRIIYLYSQTPSIIGALMAVILLSVIVVLGIWYYKGGRKFLNSPSTNSANSGSVSRSFENPYFNQEVTMSNLQVSFFTLGG